MTARTARRPEVIGAFEQTTLPNRVLFGAGRVRDLGAELETLGVSSAMLIFSTNHPAHGARVRDHSDGRIGSSWDEVRQHVPTELVERAARHLDAVDGIVAVGGGSTIGLAKALALQSGLPIVAVPTTYSGSEMTPVWGLTEGREKRTGRDPRVLPRAVVYDPELFVDLPAAIAGPSALNAFAHCAEGLYAAGANPVSRLLATEGASLLARGLAAGREDAPLERVTPLVLGAYLAGSVFAATGGDLHHRLCHLLGGRFGLPHAETHAAVLPHVLACRAPGIAGALSDLGAALGVPAGDVPGACWDQVGAVGCPNGLRALGLSEAEATEAAGVLAATGALDDRAADQLLAAAWRGERPPHLEGL